MLDTIPHSDFWALQETHLTGSEHMAAAQRRARKRGWAPDSWRPRWWGSTTRRTEAEWRSLGRSTSVRVRPQSSSRCWRKRRSWHQKAWCNHCMTCVVAFWQDTFAPCSREAGRGNSRRLRAALAGVVASSRSSLVPHSRLLRGSAQSTFPSARQRARTRGGAAAKRPRRGVHCVAWWLRLWATWLLEGRGGPTYTRLNVQSSRLPPSRLPDLGPWGPRLGLCITGGVWHTPCTMRSHQRHLDRPGQAGHAFHHEPHAASCQCFGGRICAKLAAMGDACQGSAGAGHSFTKTGIEGPEHGEHGGLAGPELLVNQVGTCLQQ